MSECAKVNLKAPSVQEARCKKDALTEALALLAEEEGSDDAAVRNLAENDEDARSSVPNLVGRRWLLVGAGHQA
jgi:hypothetical protein